MKRSGWLLGAVITMVALGGVAASVVTAAREQTPPGSGGLVTITGTLEARVLDRFDTGESIRSYSVRDETIEDRIVTLELPGMVVGAPIGRRIRVSGILRGERLVMNGIWKVLDEESVAVSDQKPGKVEESHAAEVQTFRTLVMMINFADLSQTCSGSVLDSTFFDDPDQSVAKFFNEQSFHQFDFEGLVVGPYTLEAQSSTCENFRWTREADNLADDDPVVNAAGGLNSFDSRFYIIPPVSGTYWCNTAWSWIGGTQSFAAGYCDSPPTMAHEMGHILGLDHASTITSNNVLCDGCDFSSSMGGVGQTMRHFNAPQKIQLDWIPEGRVLNVTQSGLYTISLLELDIPGTIQVLTFDQLLPGNNSYYVSYRTGIGPFASNISTNYRPRMNIHKFTGGSAFTYHLGSDANNTIAFADGQTFTEPGSDVCLTLVNHTDTTAAIWVSFDCLEPAPPVCPTLTPCNETSCLAGAETGSVNIGDSCVTSEGSLYCGEPSLSVYVVSKTCNKATCCSTVPACVCPQTCPGGEYLDCR